MVVVGVAEVSLAAGQVLVVVMMVVVLKELLLAGGEVIQGLLFQSPAAGSLTAPLQQQSPRLHQGPAHQQPQPLRASSSSTSSPRTLVHGALLLTQPLALALALALALLWLQRRH